MKAISLRKMVIAIVIVGIGAGYVRAAKQQLQAKLGKDVGFEFKDVTIAEALKKIGETAEVKIVLSDEAVWKLPYGEATRLSASLKGPLADSLSEMLNAFFMRYAVGDGDEEVTIYPRQELEHILGRPTTKQIELLQEFYTARLSHPAPEKLTSTELIKDLLRKFNVVLLPASRYEDFEIIASDLLEVRPLMPTFAQMLDSLGKWYISGINFPGAVTEIRIVDEEGFREAKLDQVVDISFEDETAEAIIQRLANWAGMELYVAQNDPSWHDPSWWQLGEKISVDMQNIKLIQAIQNIVRTAEGNINIDFGGNRITVMGPMFMKKPVALKESAPRTARTSSAAGEGYVGKISIPMDGGKYFIEFMLRESDLTEELKKLREEKIREILRKVGKAGDNAPEIAAHPQAYSILN